MDQIGERIPITGKPDMDVVGNAIHAFFAADRWEFDDRHRLDRATRILKRWNISGAIDPNHFLQLAEILSSNTRE